MIQSLLLWSVERLKDQWISASNEDLYELIKKLNDLGRRPCRVGLLGIQSAGKTTLVNALLGYPLLCATQTKGTVLPLSIDWDKESRLEVVVRKDKALRRVKLSKALTPEVSGALRDYACLCVNEKVFLPENLKYFSGNDETGAPWRAENLDTPTDNSLLNLALLLILLNAHISNRDFGANPLLSSRVLEARAGLLRMLGVPAGEIVELNLYLDNELLKKGFSIHDLPGLDSGCIYIDGDDSLDMVTFEKARQMNLLLCIITPEIVIGEMAAMLERLVKKGDAGPLPVILINMADRIRQEEIALSAVSDLLPEMPVARYLLSARSGEFRYVEAGIPIERTFFWREHYRPMLDHFRPGKPVTEEDLLDATAMLEEQYQKPYLGIDEQGNTVSVSTHDSLVSIIPALQDAWAIRELQRYIQQHRNGANVLCDILLREKKHLNNALRCENEFWKYLGDALCKGQQFSTTEYSSCASWVSFVAKKVRESRDRTGNGWQNAISELGFAFLRRATQVIKHHGGLFVIVLQQDDDLSDETGSEHSLQTVLNQICDELPQLLEAQACLETYWNTVNDGMLQCDKISSRLATMEHQYVGLLSSAPTESENWARMNALQDVYQRYCSESIERIAKDCSDRFIMDIRSTAQKWDIDRNEKAFVDVKTMLWNYLNECLQCAVMMEWTNSKRKRKRLISKHKLLRVLREHQISADITGFTSNTVMPGARIQQIMERLDAIGYYCDFRARVVNGLHELGASQLCEVRRNAFRIMKEDATRFEDQCNVLGCSE